MNLENLCKYYLTNFKLIKNKTQFKQYIRYFYDLREIKKAKLKLGSVTFEMRPVLFNGIVIKHSFEMVFSRQPLSSQSSKRIEKILNFFKWSWDFKNVTTLFLFIGVLISYSYRLLVDFYNQYINSSFLDEDHLYIVLNHIFSLIENRSFNISFIHTISSTLADISIYLSLF